MCQGTIYQFSKCRHVRDIVVTQQCPKQSGTKTFCVFSTPSFTVTKILTPSLCEECFRAEEDAIRTNYYAKIGFLYKMIASLRSRSLGRSLLGFAIANAEQKIEKYELLTMNSLALFRVFQGGKYIGNGIFISTESNAPDTKKISDQSVHLLGDSAVVASLEVPLPQKSSLNSHAEKSVVKVSQDIKSEKLAPNISFHASPLRSHPVMPADLNIGRPVQPFLDSLVDDGARRSAARRANSPRREVLKNNLRRTLDKYAEETGELADKGVPASAPESSQPPTSCSSSSSSLLDSSSSTSTPVPSAASDSLTETETIPPSVILALERQRFQLRIRKFLRHEYWSAEWGPKPKINDEVFRYGVMYPLHPQINPDFKPTSSMGSKPQEHSLSTSPTSSVPKSKFCTPSPLSLSQTHSAYSLNQSSAAPWPLKVEDLAISTFPQPSMLPQPPPLVDLSSTYSRDSMTNPVTLTFFPAFPSPSPLEDPSPLAQTLAQEQKLESDNAGLGFSACSSTSKTCRHMPAGLYDKDYVDVDGKECTTFMIERPAHVDAYYHDEEEK
ncbi:hypothetical protein L228DRAFT_259664 [Xylona heveae TC161]|uniref:Uncharacterized protein n=1 Tax=Xylona heveae (strain CBS 132557 / TC161) TaxID=1328760 RepID=A0A165I6A2_XYLHT|nr:hypothetical protein L228DRAFT_259664 [Xylona heveae TC161]KZF24448.1 hypothetical protein L228DRAFT_259664 [Xylona heveae TC161]